jgi:DNA-binding Xre family transcriptional regulator
MAVSYRKLWYRLIDKNMTKTELQTIAQISWASIAKLSKNKNINTAVLEKICYALECDISDIMEIEVNQGKIAKQTDSYRN